MILEIPGEILHNKGRKKKAGMIMAYKLMRPQCKPQDVRGVLFDMDGVILDSEKLYTRFWLEAAQALGWPMTVQQALGMRSLNRQAGVDQIHRYFGPEADYEAIRQQRIARMDAYVAHHGIDAKPGITELLGHLHARGIPAAITTSSPLDRVKAYLKPLGLLDQFQAIVTGYDVARGKPEPDIYMRGAEVIGVPPQQCLALEDSAAGILSAYRAGCMAVMVPDQDAPDEETLSRAWCVAESLLDVIDLLK